MMKNEKIWCFGRKCTEKCSENETKENENVRMKRLENHSEYVTEAKEAYAYSSVKKKKKKSKMEASPS